MPARIMGDVPGKKEEEERDGSMAVYYNFL